MAAMRTASISPSPMIPEEQAATPDQKSKHDGVSATRNSGNNYGEKPAPQGALSPSLFDSLQQRASKLKVLLNSLNGSSGNRTSGLNYAEYSLQQSPSPGPRPSNFSGAQHGKPATHDCPGHGEGRALAGSLNGASKPMPLTPQLPTNAHANPVTGHRIGAGFPSASAQPSIPITAPMPGCGAGQDRPISLPSGSHRPADADISSHGVQAASGARPHGSRDAASTPAILRDVGHPPGKAPPPAPGPGDHTILRHTQPRHPRAPSASTVQDQPRDASYQRRSTSDGSCGSTGAQPLLRVSPRITADSTQPPFNGARDTNPRPGCNVSERPAPNRPKPHAPMASAAMPTLPPPPAHRPHPPPAPPPAQPYTTGAMLSRSAGGSSDGSGRSTGRDAFTPPLAAILSEPLLAVQPRPSPSPSPPHSQSTGDDMHSPAARDAALHAAPYDPYAARNIAPVMPPRRLSAPGETYQCQDPLFDPRGSRHAHDFQRLVGHDAQEHGWSGLEALGTHAGVLVDVEAERPLCAQDSFSPRSAAAASGSSLVGAYPHSPPPGLANQVGPPRSQAAEELCAMLFKMEAGEPAGLVVAAAGGPQSPPPCRAPSAPGSNGSGAATGAVGTAAGRSAGGSDGHGSRAENMRGRAASAPGLALSEGGGDVGRELKVYKAGGSSGGASKAGDAVGVHGIRRRSSGAGSSSAATYDSEMALAHAVAVARASAIAAFLNPVARTYRQRSDFSTTGQSGSSSPLVAPLVPLFSGVPAAAAPFLGAAVEQLPYSSSPRGGTSVASGRESLPSGSLNSPRSGTIGSQYEKILARKMVSLVPAERRPRPASGGPGPEFMRRNEVLLRKRQAWATSKRKITSGGSPVSTRQQQQTQGRRAVSAQGNDAEGRSHPQLQRCLLDLHRWADWRNKRLEVLREERQAEERERDKIELTFKPAIDERSRRLAKMVRSRGTYTPLPSGASHRSLTTPPSATISTSTPGCCTTTATTTAAAVASSGPTQLSQDGSSEGPATWCLPYKYTAHIPVASRSSAGGISTGSGPTSLGGGTLMSVDQLVEALETARGGGRHRHRSSGTAPGASAGGSYSARCRPLSAVEQLAAARNSRMRGRYASSGGGSPYDDPVMGAVAQAINDAAIALQLDRISVLDSDTSMTAVADVSVLSPVSPRGHPPLPPQLPLVLSDARPPQSLDDSPGLSLGTLGRLGTARDDAAAAAGGELQGPQPTTSPSISSKRTTAWSPSAGPTNTQARASARASARAATSVASNGSRRTARRPYNASGSGGSYAKAYSGGLGGASGQHARGTGGGMSNVVATGFGSDFSGEANTNLHTGRSHEGTNNPIPLSYTFLHVASQNPTQPSPSPGDTVVVMVSGLGPASQGDVGVAQEAAEVAAGGYVCGGGMGRAEGMATVVPMLMGSHGNGLVGVDVLGGLPGGSMGTSALGCGLSCSPSSSGSIAVGAFRSGSLASSPGSSPYLILPYDGVGTPPLSSSRSPSQSQSQSSLPRVSTPTASASSGTAAVGAPTFSVVFSTSSGGGSGSGTGPAAEGRPSNGGGGVSIAMPTSTFLLPRPSGDVDPYHTCLSVEAAAAGKASTASPRQPSVVRFSTGSENARLGSAGGLPDGSSLHQDSQDPMQRRSGAVSEGDGLVVLETVANGVQPPPGFSHGRPSSSSGTSVGGTLGGTPDSAHAYAHAASAADSLLPSVLSHNAALASQSSALLPEAPLSVPSDGFSRSSSGLASKSAGGSVAVGAVTTAGASAVSRMEGAPRQASASAATGMGGAAGGAGGAHSVNAHPARPRAVSAVLPSGSSAAAASGAGPCLKQSPKRNVARGAVGPRRGSAGSSVIAPSSSDPFTGMRFSKILSQQFASTASSLAAARALSHQPDACVEVPTATLVAPTCSAPELTAVMAPQTPGETTKYLALLAALTEKRRQPPTTPVVVHPHHQHPHHQHNPSSSAPASRHPSGYGNALGRMAGRMASSGGPVGGGMGGAEGPAVRDAAACRSHFRLDAISPGMYAGPGPQGREALPAPASNSSQSSPRGKAVSFNLSTSQHKSQPGNSPPRADAAAPLFIAFPAPSTPAAAVAMPVDLSLTVATQRQAAASFPLETVGMVPEHHVPVWNSADLAAAAAAVTGGDHEQEQGLPSDTMYMGRRKRRSSEDGCSKVSGKAAKTLTNAVGESVQDGDVALEDGASGGGGDPPKPVDPAGTEKGLSADPPPGPPAERLATPASAVTSPPPPPSPPPPSTVEEDDDPLAALQALIRRVAHLADDCDAAAAAAALSGHVTAVSSTLTSPCLSSNPATSAPDVAKPGDRDLGQELVSQVSSAPAADGAAGQHEIGANMGANNHTVLADHTAPPTSLRKPVVYGDTNMGPVRAAEPVAVGTLSSPRGMTCESASGTGGSAADDYVVTSTGSCNLNLTDVVSSSSAGEVLTGESQRRLVVEPSTSTVTSEAGPLQAAIAGVLGSQGSTPSLRSPDQDSLDSTKQQPPSAASGRVQSSGCGGVEAALAGAPKNEDSSRKRSILDGETESAESTEAGRTRGTSPGLGLVARGRQAQLHAQLQAAAASDGVSEVLSTGSLRSYSPASTGPSAAVVALTAAASAAREDVTNAARGEGLPPTAAPLSVTDLVKRAEQLRVAAMTAAGIDLGTSPPAPTSRPLVSWGSTLAAPYSAIFHSPSTPLSALNFTPLGFHYPDPAALQNIVVQQPQPPLLQHQQSQPQQQQPHAQEHQKLRQSHSSPSALRHEVLRPSSSCCTTPTPSATAPARVAPVPIASGGASNNVAVTRHVSRLPGSNGANSAARRRAGSSGGGGGGGGYARTPSPPGHVTARRASAPQSATAAGGSKAGGNNGDFVFPRLYADGALTAAGIRAHNLVNTSGGGAGGGGGGGGRQRQQPAAAVGQQHHHHQAYARNKQGGGGKGSGARGSASGGVKSAVVMMPDGRLEEEMEIPHEISLAGGLDPSPVAAQGANLRRVLVPSLSGAMDNPAPAGASSAIEPRYSVWSLADALNSALEKAAAAAPTRDAEAADGAHGPMGQEGGSAAGNSVQGGVLVAEDGGGAARGAGSLRPPLDMTAAVGGGASTSMGMGGSAGINVGASTSAGVGTSAAGTALTSTGSTNTDEVIDRKQHRGVCGAVVDDGVASLDALHDLIRKMAEL